MWRHRNDSPSDPNDPVGVPLALMALCPGSLLGQVDPGCLGHRTSWSSSSAALTRAFHTCSSSSTLFCSALSMASCWGSREHGLQTPHTSPSSLPAPAATLFRSQPCRPRSGEGAALERGSPSQRAEDRAVGTLVSDGSAAGGPQQPRKGQPQRKGWAPGVIGEPTTPLPPQTHPRPSP